jgi:hypothetical protein
MTLNREKFWKPPQIFGKHSENYVPIKIPSRSALVEPEGLSSLAEHGTGKAGQTGEAKSLSVPRNVTTIAIGKLVLLFSSFTVLQLDSFSNRKSQICIPYTVYRILYTVNQMPTAIRF